MTYTIIPVPAVPNAALECVLNGLRAQLNFTTTDYGLFADIVYDGTPVANGQLCLDRTDLNLAVYKGLPDPLFFADLQGQTDPIYTGFNSRYLLIYGNPENSGGSVIPDNNFETPLILPGGLLDISFILDDTSLS